MSTHVRPFPTAEALPSCRRPSITTLQTFSAKLQELTTNRRNTYCSLSHLPAPLTADGIFSDLQLKASALANAIRFPDRKPEDHDQVISRYLRACRIANQALRDDLNHFQGRRVGRPVELSPEHFISDLEILRNTLPRFRIRGSILRFDHQPIISHNDLTIDTPVLEVVINLNHMVNGDSLTGAVTFEISDAYPDLPNYFGTRGYNRNPHPHLNDGGQTICWGDARALLHNAWEARSLITFVSIIQSFLDTYNHDDPYLHFGTYYDYHPLTPGTFTEHDEDEFSDDEILEDDFYPRDLIALSDFLPIEYRVNASLTQRHMLDHMPPFDAHNSGPSSDISRPYDRWVSCAIALPQGLHRPVGSHFEGYTAGINSRPYDIYSRALYISGIPANLDLNMVLGRNLELWARLSIFCLELGSNSDNIAPWTRVAEAIGYINPAPLPDGVEAVTRHPSDGAFQWSVTSIDHDGYTNTSSS